MNTKQKLTLGIAAIFMVTLTIVGVTYAYFVTRVTTNNAATVEVQTTSIGSVVYQPGNGTNDVLSLNNIQPGEIKYKTFSVTNEGPSDGAPSSYSIFYTSTPDIVGTTVNETTTYAPQFVHSTDNAGTNCFNVANVKSSNETGYTESCFAGTTYDNIYYTLYSVSKNDYDTINEATTAGTLNNVNLATAGTVVKAESRVAAQAGVITSSAAVADEDVKTNIQIQGQDTQYYVLKVEYRNNNMNQNIENLAKLDIKVNIR